MSANAIHEHIKTTQPNAPTAIISQNPRPRAKIDQKYEYLQDTGGFLSPDINPNSSA